MWFLDKIKDCYNQSILNACVSMFSILCPGKSSNGESFREREAQPEHCSQRLGVETRSGVQGRLF